MRVGYFHETVGCDGFSVALVRFINSLLVSTSEPFIGRTEASEKLESSSLRAPNGGNGSGLSSCGAP